ncbi:SET domain-containing protein [Trametes polyzona]|nr:SET domain-containing protein [Trametes polyzona]
MEPFIIQEIPNKGRGAVAAHPIAAGEVILEESPLLVQQYQVTDQSIASGLSILSRGSHVRFLSLANAWKGVHKALMGIWLTNALPCGTPEDPTGDVAHVEGIFLTAARFNSSCSPNVLHRWDEVSQRLVLRAVHDIDVGEELCLAYVDVIASREERRAALKKHYNFACCCEVCTLQGDDLEESNRRRSQIARIRREIPGYLDPAYGLRKTKLALQLLQEEGVLEYHCASFYGSGYEFCACERLICEHERPRLILEYRSQLSVAGDVESARSWAMKAWQATCTEKGPHAPLAQYWSYLIEHPEDCDVFGRGERLCKLEGPDV